MSVDEVKALPNQICRRLGFRQWVNGAIFSDGVLQRMFRVSPTWRLKPSLAPYPVFSPLGVTPQNSAILAYRLRSETSPLPGRLSVPWPPSNYAQHLLHHGGQALFEDCVGIVYFADLIIISDHLLRQVGVGQHLGGALDAHAGDEVFEGDEFKAFGLDVGLEDFIAAHTPLCIPARAKELARESPDVLSGGSA